MSHYEKAWQAVAERIERAVQAAGRAAGSVRLLAVSKTFPADAVRAVHAAGQRSFGENHVQEGAAKRQATADLPDVVWHLIGPLQGNKTRLAAETFDWVESVDRLKIAQRLSAQRPTDRAPLDVCVQVNVSGEASKSGVAPERGAGARAGCRRPAANPPARNHGHSGAHGGSGATAGAISPPAGMPRELRRGGIAAGHAVDGHVGGSRSRDRRRIDAGARGHGDFWSEVSG